MKYLQICDTKTIVMEETNQQSLYVCFATLSEWHCRFRMKSAFLADKNREYIIVERQRFNNVLYRHNITQIKFRTVIWISYHAEATINACGVRSHKCER